MTRGTPSLTPADIEYLIARAEADLAGLMLRHAREAGPPPDPSDPADPARCLQIWLAALRSVRAPQPAFPSRCSTACRPSASPSGRSRSGTPSWGSRGPETGGHTESG